MGMEFGDDGTMCYDDAENRHPPTPTDMLAFHTSWDWLMPVVEKCYNEESEEMNNLGATADISMYLTDVDISGTYEAVVVFIEGLSVKSVEADTKAD